MLQTGKEAQMSGAHNIRARIENAQNITNDIVAILNSTDQITCSIKGNGVKTWW